jgi:hypothetical protein
MNICLNLLTKIATILWFSICVLIVVFYSLFMNSQSAVRDLKTQLRPPSMQVNTLPFLPFHPPSLSLCCFQRCITCLNDLSSTAVDSENKLVLH